MEERSTISTYDVLGTSIHFVQIPDVVARMEQWIARREACKFIAFCNVHMIMESRKNNQLRSALAASALTVPDGKPLICVGRHKGFELKRRVYGPDLFHDFIAATHRKGYQHFFYGGHAGVPERMIDKLRQCYPGLQVAGYYSPPFRQLTAEEDEAAVAMINEAQADVLWVGLGCPKQEVWMHRHRDRLNVPVVLGVGQAFNIVAGTLPQAPLWMREHGLEWLFRLVQEPRRLWKRYLVYNTGFVMHIALEAIGFRK
jgi:N-acetylglucosaminyldiphosphoundecaprenol N-acetyl-beta-D-mannosaminyltransferase